MASLLVARRCCTTTSCPTTIASAARRSTQQRLVAANGFRGGGGVPSRGGGGGHHFRRRFRTAAVASQGRALSTLAGGGFVDPAFFLYGGREAYGVRCHDYDSDSSGDRQRSYVMATSAIAVEDQENLIRRAVRWLEQFARNCWDAVVFAARGSEVAARMLPLAALTPLAVLSDPLFLSYGRNNFWSDWAWGYFCYQQQQLGPAFVKLCQWVATRRDMFPPHVCDRLSKLHDRGIPHAWVHTRRALQQAFGKDYEEKGLRVEPGDVVGCGSAAQVYRGTMVVAGEDGEEGEERQVAVKVLHPNFQHLVDRDLWFMETASRILHSLPFERIRLLNMPKAASSFGAVLRRQADLRLEGENLKQFRANFYGKGGGGGTAEDDSSIVFPRPVEGWMGESVLVEDYVADAVPISCYLRDDSEEGVEIRREIAAPLLRAFLKMVFLDNFTHCDLHPGNVLIQTTLVPKRSSSSSRGRSFWDFCKSTAAAEPAADDDEHDDVELKRTIVFLDAGIATSLDAQHRQNLNDLFKAVILNDGARAGRLMVERAPAERCSEREGGVEEFSRGIEDLVREFHDNRKEGLTLGAVRVGSLLSRVLDLCRIHGVEVDPAMASIVISTLVLEGLGRSLEPSLNLMDFAVPFVLGRGRV